MHLTLLCLGFGDAPGTGLSSQRFVFERFLPSTEFSHFKRSTRRAESHCKDLLARQVPGDYHVAW